MQEDVAGRKEVKEEDVGSGNSSTDSVNYGSGPDYQICILLGPEPGHVLSSGIPKVYSSTLHLLL
jgi:hypothetical protein